MITSRVLLLSVHYDHIASYDAVIAFCLSNSETAQFSSLLYLTANENNFFLISYENKKNFTGKIPSIAWISKATAGELTSKYIKLKHLLETFTNNKYC